MTIVYTRNGGDLSQEQVEQFFENLDGVDFK